MALEGLQKLQDIIDNGSSIQTELADIDKAATDQEMLSIAHRIRAKRAVRQDLIFEIGKALNEIKGTTI